MVCVDTIHTADFLCMAHLSANNKQHGNDDDENHINITTTTTTTTTLWSFSRTTWQAAVRNDQTS